MHFGVVATAPSSTSQIRNPWPKEDPARKAHAANAARAPAVALRGSLTKDPRVPPHNEEFSQAWPALQEVTIRWCGSFGYLTAWAGEGTSRDVHDALTSQLMCACAAYRHDGRHARPRSPWALPAGGVACGGWGCPYRMHRRWRGQAMRGRA